QKSFFVLMMLLNSGITGLFIAYDLFLFLMFYGITLFSMFLLITLFTSKSENINNGHFGLYALISFCLLTIGILVINTQNPLSGFNLSALTRSPEALTNIQTGGFFIFLIGFLLIAPVVPFHTWFVPAAGNSIASVSILLLALFSKISIFGILQIVIPLFPQSSMQFALIFGILGLVSILYFAFCVFSFPQYQKIVIYFTGFLNAFIYLGLSALLSIKQQNLDAALAGLNGAVIQSISAGLLIVIMVLLPKIRQAAVNKISASGTNRWAVMFMMMMVLLAGIGLPGFLNFIGQFLCLAGAFHLLSTGIFSVFALLGLILVGVQFFKIIRSTIQNTNEFEFSVNLHEISNEVIIVPAILIMLFLLGIFPETVLQMIGRSVYSLIEYITAI
ncbi:MAG: proton-conducting transporter membrane subunit, partial [Candidatus Marinimicrobia bacterium]|nr:proton-conducting transporter membrane subunit [Candidatus Neomarinimicrobiota bacterium]